MDKTHCFYIITTVKPNIRINRRGAVLPQARGRFTPGMGQNGFIGAHFKFVITFPLGRAPGCPKLPYNIDLDIPILICFICTFI